MIKLQLTLIKKNEIFHFVLPEKVSGKYWIAHTNDKKINEQLISVEAVEGKWVLKSNKYAFIRSEKNEKIKEIIVEYEVFYSIFIVSSGEQALLISNPVTEDRLKFNKFMVTTCSKLSIGRSEDNDISFSNKFVSFRHAELVFDGSIWTINDLGSSNGTFVNGLRISKRQLVCGDIIYIMGLKIIMGKNFIAVNNPDGKVHCNEKLLNKFIMQKPENADDDDDEVDTRSVNDKLFYRSPRFKRDIEKAVIKIDAPPSITNIEEVPMMLMLGPSMTMGMTSLFTGLLTLQNVMRTHGDMMSAAPTLVMSFSMLIGTIMWPILTKRYENKKKIQHEKLRQEKYKKYIQDIRDKISDECNHQSEILSENYVTLDDCMSRIKFQRRNLWERMSSQNDFLKVRIGIGDLPLNADIKFPEKKFTLEEDNLQDELYKLAQEPKMLKDVPITLSFAEENVVGIIGKREMAIEFVNGLIVQLTALHSYDEFKIIFIYDKNEKDIWNYCKWLPHVWNDEKTVRFIADDKNQVKELSAYIEKEIKNRESKNNNNEKSEYITPYYLLFSMSKSLSGNTEMFNLILKQKKKIGFSIVTLYDELKNLPKECTKVVELEDNISKIYDKNDISGKYISFKPDIFLKDGSEELAIYLSNIKMNTSNSAYSLPDMLTFLEMFKVSKVEHLNSLTRWKENDPTISLETEIGVDTMGELFKLDLHEKYHGPHGLVAGMTGSGKSEFIITYILSLAINYHPNEVAFILIDYKGGGMANAFADLPHVAGTITNLDGSAVKRSLVSIQSELKRRQRIFSETSKKVNVSNIDIYKYQKLFREGAVTEPLQHLFIISDEFAELKTQQPEFMEQLVSAARIGRSLGVHLILATQKPSGVVDDQIWSNSRFRICLKVQEKADSMDMIKRPDAAELSLTGRFYLQVGFNELFELGQSAWAGAPYYPSDRIEKQKDNSMEIIDSLGRTIKKVQVDKRKKSNKKPPKQIDEITKYLSNLAKEENIHVKQLWLQPISSIIYIDELKKKYNAEKAKSYILNPTIGEYDDPAHQRQLMLTLPISSEGNTAIYGVAGSGKTTFLTSLIYSLIEEHTPDEINLYILDFASETLGVFSKAPHVGNVIFSHESEKINNLFKIICKTIEERKKLFSDYGGDYQSYITKSNNTIPSIIIMINNYSAFVETYEDKEEMVAYISREGTKYGIYFVVTALNTGDIRYRILQNFKQLFVLQLNDQSDYTGVLGNTDGVFPSKYKGRGILKKDCAYEFQTAHISKNAKNEFEYIRNFCSDYAKEWKGTYAKKIPILPDKFDVEYIQGQVIKAEDGKLPIGVEKSSLNIVDYDFEKNTISLVFSQNNDKVSFIQGLSELLSINNSIYVFDTNENYKIDKNIKYTYINDSSKMKETIIDMFNTLVKRNNIFKDTEAENKTPPVFEKIYYIINSLSSLINILSPDEKDKLYTLLERSKTEYNVFFIIADTVNNIAAVAFEEWFKVNASVNDGIWIGNGISEQYQLKVSKMTNEMYKEVENGFGYCVNKGQTKLIKLLSSISSEVED